MALSHFKSGLRSTLGIINVQFDGLLSHATNPDLQRPRGSTMSRKATLKSLPSFKIEETVSRRRSSSDLKNLPEMLRSSSENLCMTRANSSVQSKLLESKNSAFDPLNYAF